MNKIVIFLTTVFMSFFIFVGLSGYFVLSQNNQGQQEQRRETNVVLPQNQVVNNDYLVAGDTVTIFGTIEEDAYIAGGTVLVDGTINGSLLIAGGDVNITGSVNENIRVLGGQVNISGPVGGNVSVIGGNVTVSPQAEIAGSFVSAIGNLNLNGRVGRSVHMVAGNAYINSAIAGDTQIVGSNISLGPTASIGQNLVYWSENEANIQQGANVAGQVERREARFMQRREERREGRLVGLTLGYLVYKVLSVIPAFIVGIALISFFPVYMKKALHVMSRRPWIAILTGLITLIAVPVLFIILLVTVVGIPIAFILIALYFILLYIAQIPVALFIGNKVFNYSNKTVAPVWSLLVGLIILAFVTLIPVLGWVVSFIVLILGLGSLLISERDTYMEIREKKVV